MRTIMLILTAVALAVAAPAIADKGGNGNSGVGNGGNGGGNGGSATTTQTATPTSKPSSYSPTLSVSWPLGPASATSTSMPYTVGGCGYDATYGAVTVVVYTPVSAAFTSQMPDGSGCISVSNFSTQGAGSYTVDALQTVHHKQSVVASTSFTVS